MFFDPPPHLYSIVYFHFIFCISICNYLLNIFVYLLFIICHSHQNVGSMMTETLPVWFIILAYCLVYYKWIIIICQNAFINEVSGRSHITKSLVCHVVEMELYPIGNRSHQEMVSKRAAYLYIFKQSSQRQGYLRQHLKSRWNLEGERGTFQGEVLERWDGQWSVCSGYSERVDESITEGSCDRNIAAGRGIAMCCLAWQCDSELPVNNWYSLKSADELKINMMNIIKNCPWCVRNPSGSFESKLKSHVLTVALLGESNGGRGVQFFAFYRTQIHGGRDVPQVPDSHLALCSRSLVELLEVANGCALQTELKEFTGWVFVNLGVFIILPVFISVKADECIENEDGICVYHRYHVHDTELVVKWHSVNGFMNHTTQR